MAHEPGKKHNKNKRGTAPGRFYRDLESWIRRRLLNDLAPEALPSSIQLPLEIPVILSGKGRQAARRRFEHSLERQLGRIEERLEMEYLGFRAGHVYCHWCGSPICAHTSAPDERSVFTGYSPTGQPRWRDFSSWIIERRDPRLDRLFVDRPRPLAVFSSGRELAADLLSDFGRHGGPYRIVAQVAAGFFPLPTPTGSRDPFAFTAHLVERRQGGGDPNYILNLIASPPPPHHLPTLVAERIEPRLSEIVEALRKSQRDLGEFLTEARRSGRRVGLRDSRARACQGFESAAQLFEKALRRDSRRTEHAQERTLDPSRPTTSALSDALAAKTTDLFLDRTEDTVIVRGPRRRVHVYRRDGTHITSIVYPGETIRERIRRGRWSPLDEADAVRLREGLQGHSEELPD